jgi:hypothetical protein
MSAKVIAIQTPRQSMALIAIMSGKFDRDGDLHELTEQKLERAMAAADNWRRQNPPRPYAYVFPDCSRHEGEGQRVCDVQRLKVMAADPHCRTVAVPPADADFVTDAERLAFFNEVKAGIVGDCLMLV